MGTSRDLPGVDRFRDDLTSQSGTPPAYWQWPIPIKILFVIDGAIDLSLKVTNFGLGYVLDTLLAPFSASVELYVDIAKRDGDLDASNLGGQTLTYQYFKFTQAGFDLNSYDQVWFYGNNPSDFTVPVTDDNISGGWPLDDHELRLLADWMEKGGGVFAAGDHHILGASMCHRIPRVRTMRRWTQVQGVPPKYGPLRHQTLQPTLDPEPEGDLVLQPLELVYQHSAAGWPFARLRMPHPLLTSTLGVIDRFPDHMHEGEVIADEAVQLDLPPDISGYTSQEYPFTPQTVDSAQLHWRPRPHVIAFGRTTTPENPDNKFGVVGVYDGDSVGLGRVVVDSTWHHWFSLNLNGIAKHDLPAYEKMQAYYRNVGLWLARPSQRASVLISSIWGVLIGSPPMAFDNDLGPWEVGERVLARLGHTFSPSMLGELIAPLVDRQILVAWSGRGKVNQSEPLWSSLPDDLVKRALAGGIGSALIDLSLDHQQKRARGQRPRLNPEAIRLRAIEGISRGHVLLRKSVEDAATTVGAMHAALSVNSTPQSVNIRIPIDLRRLRVVAETLQFPDPGDPAVISGEAGFTIRLRLDESVAASRVFEGVKLLSFEARGSVIDLSCDVGEVEVQTGESLSIEVLVGSGISGQANPEDIRFTHTRLGNASTWIGKSVPPRSQVWRLWYRIEEKK
jgi:hypothetical protein